jgi:hypothetical protein
MAPAKELADGPGVGCPRVGVGMLAVKNSRKRRAARAPWSAMIAGTVSSSPVTVNGTISLLEVAVMDLTHFVSHNPLMFQPLNKHIFRELYIC